MPSSASDFPLTLRLENLSASCTIGHLKALVGSFGSIKSMETPLPALWMPFPVGRCEIQMESEEETINAFAHLDGCNLDGSRIRARLVRIDPTKEANKRPAVQPAPQQQQRSVVHQNGSDRRNNNAHASNGRSDIKRGDDRRGNKRERSPSRRRDRSRSRDRSRRERSRGRRDDRDRRRDDRDYRDRSRDRSRRDYERRRSPSRSPSRSDHSSPARVTPPSSPSISPRSSPSRSSDDE